MSNIITSYIRIFKKDGSHLTNEEIEILFQLAVRAYEQFGSYWVRIQKKYRTDKKCLDIQFGSSKTYGDELLDSYEIFQKYYVWERTADEGGRSDTISTLTDNGDWIDMSSDTCLYQFNTVKITTPTLSPYFMEHNPIKTGKDEFELHMIGEYNACSSRSFFEVTEDNPNCYGPCLQYDDTYETDFNSLSDDGLVTKSEMQFIKDVFIDPHRELNVNEQVELLWNDRVVQSIKRTENNIICESADYWDNCCNSNYLGFINSK